MSHRDPRANIVEERIDHQTGVTYKEREEDDDTSATTTCPDVI
jgi:hypothetical protein